MRQAEVHVQAQELAPVSPYLWGALTEHFGHGIYGGIWDAERNVPRADVLAATRALGVSMLRYPGGCFSAWYHWRDGVGSRAQRPVHERTYWTDFDPPGLPPGTGSVLGPRETNAFGTDEFLRYCLAADAEPLLVANHGSGTPEEAADWVRHCNVSGEAPRPVRWWAVGNETFGPWEIGHCSGGEYGKQLVPFVEAMRGVDPDLRIIGVGEAAREGSTFTTDMLREAGDVIDAVSVHFYFPGPWIGRELRDDEGDQLQVMSGADELGSCLDTTIAEIDSVVGPERRMAVSLDEWNLWSAWSDLITTTNRLADGPLFAGFLNRMIERADRVQIAMVSHLVNCMAPIQTRGDRMFVTTGYLVQQLYRTWARDVAVPVEIECGTVHVPAFADLSEPARAHLFSEGRGVARDAADLDATATADATGTTVFLANRRLDEALEVTVTGLPVDATGRLRWLDADSPWARNDEDHPDAISFRERVVATDGAGAATVTVPPGTVAALAVS